MPHFQYSGRYWRFAGDEIFVPGFIATFWRTVWTCIMLLILFSTLHRLSTCSDGWFLLTYLGFSVFSCILSILCEVLLVNVSLKGTLIESEARSGVGFYLTAHGILGCLQFCLSMCGFVIVFAHSQIPCSTSFQDNVDTALLSFVVISQLIDVITQLCCCYIFSAQKIEEELEPDDGESDEESVTLHQIELDMENNEEERDSLKLEELEEGGSTNSNTLSKKQNRKLRRTRRRGDSTITLSEEISVWESRCKSICKGLQMVSCNAFGGANLHVAEDFEAVAKVLTHFFQHDGFLDVVPSDVAAGKCHVYTYVYKLGILWSIVHLNRCVL